MDSITQFVLGASVAEACWGKKLGNKAILWGGTLGTVPDLDVIPGKAMELLTSIEFHRGPTHSIVFALVMAIPFARLMNKIHPKKLTLQQLKLGVFLCLFTHILLDICTTWGTQIFWPFLTWPVAWQTIFVADPLYTLPFIFALIRILFLPPTSHIRRKWNRLTLFITSAYLLIWCPAIKWNVNQHFETSLKNQSSTILQWSSRPTPLNTIFWTANAETPDSFLIGYHSVFDNNQTISWDVIPKNVKLREAWSHHPAYQRLKTISKDQFLIEQHHEGFVFKDLRFGQAGGWSNPKADFVFRYQVQAQVDEPNYNVIALPRPFDDPKQALVDLWFRIWGLTPS